MRKFLVFVSLVFFAGLTASAELRKSEQGLRGFVKVSEGRELYVNWTYAKSRMPTVILINGLTYSTKHWDKFTNALTAKGFGVLRYDPFGMGETLLKYAPLMENVLYQAQVEDLKALVKTLKLAGKLNIIGLSYGGGIGIAFSAKYPELVKNMIAMAPYTAPVTTQDEWVRSQVWLTRKANPWVTATDAELYEFYFRQMVYLTYPMAEPSVLENPFKLEATFRMAIGIRELIALDVVQTMPTRSLHLIVAGSDQYIARDVLENFWDKVPSSVKATKTIFNNVEHKIPEAAPNFSAAYVEMILKENGILGEGREFDADPVSGKVKYDGGSFQLPKGY